MSFFVGKNEGVVDQVTEPSLWRDRVDGFVSTMDAVKELREDNGAGLGLKGGWKHVASIRGPVLEVAELVDGDMINDKRKFYGWLDRHPEYSAYDRRAAMARTGKTFWGADLNKEVSSVG
jgi:hypothetical protein